jgi:hypothetical protein
MEKMTKNKRVLMIACSLTAVSLTIALIAAASSRGRKHKLIQSKGFLEQTNPKTSVITTIVTHSQQQEEKPQPRLQPPWQGSDTNKQTATATTTAAAINSTTNVSIDDKDITSPEVVLSSTVPSSTSDSTVIVSSSPPSFSQTSREEEISVSDEAKKAGESLKELIVTAIKEAKDSATGTGKQLKEQTIDIAAKADSKDIHSLRDNVNVSVGLFEEMMIEIRKERYNEQIKLLDSYKDLLQTHINVADARRRMASKLKPGA